jgi:anthranilate synthase component 2
MLLVIDNYDSFTWNLHQALASLGLDVRVVRNDALSVDAALSSGARGILLSPGPGRPADSGICPQVLARAPARLPLLGVCLGHQALVEHYGGAVVVDPQPVHGRSTRTFHDGSALFANAPDPFDAGRYHSLHAPREALPRELIASAWTEDGRVMAVRHAELPRYGVQFHPESILTPAGPGMLAAFARLCGEAPLRDAPAVLRPS